MDHAHRLALVEERLGDVRGEVSHLRTEIGSVRTEMGTLRSDLASALLSMQRQIAELTANVEAGKNSSDRVAVVVVIVGVFLGAAGFALSAVIGLR